MNNPIVLLGYEAKCFEAWRDLDPDFSVLSFGSIATRSGCPREKVRRAVRALARKGLVIFCQSAWSDDGLPCGAGYGLTPAGVEHFAATENTVVPEGYAA
jgi:hypothetical protein